MYTRAYVFNRRVHFHEKLHKKYCTCSSMFNIIYTADLTIFTLS